MTDLPIPAILPAATAAPAPRSAASNSLLKDAAATDGASQVAPRSFQEALKLELESGLDGSVLSPSSIVATADPNVSLESRDDAAQAIATSDALPGLVFVGTAIPPPSLPVAPVPPPPHAPMDAARTVAALEPNPAPLKPINPSAEPGSPIQPESGQQLPALPSTANFAAPDKFLPVATSEAQKEVPLDPSLLEKPRTVQIAPTVLHSDRVPEPFAPAPTTTLNAPLGQRGWDQGLGDQLVWMASQKHQVAELHLNPPDLGPLKIRLTLDSDFASAQFVSHHAAVREAIEAAMPRLKEMLADCGIALGNTSISAESFRERAQQEAQAYASQADIKIPDTGVINRGVQLLHIARGLVDTYV